MDEEQGLEHREQVDRLEREAEKLEQESARVGDKIEEARGDWKAKEGDVAVPGAQPDLEKVLNEEADEEEAKQDEDSNGDDADNDTDEEEES